MGRGVGLADQVPLGVVGVRIAGRGRLLVLRPGGVAGRVAVAVEVVAIRLGPRAAHSRQLVGAVVRECRRPFGVLLGRDAIGLIVAVDIGGQRGGRPAATAGGGCVRPMRDCCLAVRRIVDDRRVHLGRRVAAADLPLDRGQPIAVVVAVNDLRAGRAAVGGGDRRHPLGEVIRIGRDPLARQAIGDARLVAELVIAVGQRHRRLTGPRAGGRGRLQFAIVVIGERQGGVTVGRAGHQVCGVVRVGDDVECAPRAAQPRLACLVAVRVICVSRPPPVRIGRVGQLAVLIVDEGRRAPIGLGQGRHAAIRVVRPLGLVPGRVDLAGLAASRVVGDRGDSAERVDHRRGSVQGIVERRGAVSGSPESGQWDLRTRQEPVGTDQMPARLARAARLVACSS